VKENITLIFVNETYEETLVLQKNKNEVKLDNME